MWKLGRWRYGKTAMQKGDQGNEGINRTGDRKDLRSYRIN